MQYLICLDADFVCYTSSGATRHLPLKGKAYRGPRSTALKGKDLRAIDNRPYAGALRYFCPTALLFATTKKRGKHTLVPLYARIKANYAS